MTSRPALLFACTGVDDAPWLAAFAAQAPDIDVHPWPARGREADIAYALAWNAPAGTWARFPALKAIFSLGAGVDTILADPKLPRHVPVVRMIDPGLVTGMREYVALHVLRHHRQFDELARQQAEHEWNPLTPPLAAGRTVGILGLGQLGTACAETLLSLGFRVCGWSRTPHDLPGVETFTGPEGLAEIARRSEILVNLLPLTPETADILDANLFDLMPKGAAIVNAGRGGHLVEEDLLAAIWRGQIGAATLDVFRTEPLPPEHVFWDEPGITITPHNAAPTRPETAVATLLANLRGFIAGAPLSDVVDRALGY